jgi:hypothetical protein
MASGNAFRALVDPPHDGNHLCFHGGDETTDGSDDNTIVNVYPHIIPLLEDTLKEWGFLQVMTEVIQQESYQATLHPLPMGSTIIGGQGKE